MNLSIRILVIMVSGLMIFACSAGILQKKSAMDEAASATFMPDRFEGMVHIPGGWFRMGSNKKSNESPPHRVYVRGFYLDATEVTVGDFRQFCRQTGRKMPEQPIWSSDAHPVVNVTWHEAKAYANWQDKRLPTEAEWEFAARGGQNSVKYAYNAEKVYLQSYGNIADESILNVKERFPVKSRYDDGFPFAAPVRSFPPIDLGLYDMEGNVLEWCSDWYGEDYYGKADKLNPKGPENGHYRVVRGASYNRSGQYLRATYRSWFPANVRFEFLGFRCAKSEDAKKNINASTASSDGSVVN